MVDASAAHDGNSVPTLTGASNVDGTTPVRVYADPVTHRLLVDMGSGGGGALSQVTVSGTINGVNPTFTIPTAPNGDIILFLARQMQVLTTDYTISGTTITYVIPPDLSLNGQPHVAYITS